MQRINWYRTPIGKNIIKELTKKSDAKGVLQAGSFLIIFAATAYLAYYYFARQMWVAMAAAAYIHCIFHSFVGMESAVHELSHGTAFKTKWLNDFFYYLFCFLTWNNAVHFRESHTRHHQYTAYKGLDYEVILKPISFTLLDYISWFLFDYAKIRMVFIPAIANFFGGDIDPFAWSPLFEKDDPRRKKMFNWARVMVIGHGILLVLFIYYQLWILIFVITFGYFFASSLARGTGIQQHLGLRPDVPDWRVNCHTVAFGPVMAYLYWNMNYHIEHHMYAAVPFCNTRKLHGAIAYDTPATLMGYWRGVGRILSIQKLQKKDPAYIVDPVFPDTATLPGGAGNAF
jgi:fatty acid desaturase